MIRLYDPVKITKTEQLGHVIEIDDNNGKSAPIYLVEIDDKPDNADVTDVIKWYDYSEIECIRTC